MAQKPKGHNGKQDQLEYKREEQNRNTVSVPGQYGDNEVNEDSTSNQEYSDHNNSPFA